MPAICRGVGTGPFMEGDVTPSRQGREVNVTCLRHVSISLGLERSFVFTPNLMGSVSATVAGGDFSMGVTSEAAFRWLRNVAQQGANEAMGGLFWLFVRFSGPILVKEGVRYYFPSRVPLRREYNVRYRLPALVLCVANVSVPVNVFVSKWDQ